jgi:hypothetical protein
MAAAIFHAAEEQRPSIGQKRYAGVEDGVNGIRPVVSGQNRIARMAMQKRFAAGHESSSWRTKIDHCDLTGLPGSLSKKV